MNINENHEKIIKFMEGEGPSLPIQIARRQGINSLFVSAFLSELVNNKRIKVSHLKVGGSPLYFLEGQEEQLEPYHRYLHPKEGDAFLMLKKAKVLKDSDQEPSIRVALRSIRDFAFGFRRGEEIFWRYFLISQDEVEDILDIEKKDKVDENLDEENINEFSEEDVKEAEELLKNEKIKVDLISKDKKIEIKRENEFKNPLVIKKEEKIKKGKTKSDFVLNVIKLINSKRLKIIKENDYKAKEYNCIVKINSDLGDIEFLTQAKDKKTISEADLKKLLSTAQSIPLPALLICNGEISKKAKEFLDKYKSILKIIELENA